MSDARRFLLAGGTYRHLEGLEFDEVAEQLAIDLGKPTPAQVLALQAIDRLSVGDVATIGSRKVRRVRDL